jgi:hypothetical protein
MPSLLDLPSELVLEIVSNFRPPQRSIESEIHKTNALRHLCLTCIRLRSIAQPLLFESIGFVSKNGGYSFRQLAAVLRDFPQLAQKAKTWYLEPFCLLRESQNRPEGEVWNPADVPRALDTALHLVNVETLHLLGGRYSWAHFTGNLGEDILESHDGDRPALPLLKTLCIAPTAHPIDRPGCFVNIVTWRDFLGHPGIETVCIQYGVVADPFTEWHPTYMDPKSLNVTNLQLDRCYFTRLGLTRFLSTCKAIKTFHFTAMDEIDHIELPVAPSEDPEPMMPSELINILRMCKNTLEHLSLDLAAWTANYVIIDITYGTDPIDFTYHNLQDFAHLTSLEIELDFFDKTSDPLATLETLTFTHCENIVLEKDIIFLGETLADTCPLLKLVRFEGTWSNEHSSAFRDLWKFEGWRFDEIISSCYKTTPIEKIGIVVWNAHDHDERVGSWYAGYERWRKVTNEAERRDSEEEVWFSL